MVPLVEVVDDTQAGMVAPGHVQAIHPEHGEAVVFLPGERLPDWAAKAFADQKPVPTRQGSFTVFVLSPVAKEGAP